MGQTVTVTITEPATARLFGFQATARRVSNLAEMAGSFSGTSLRFACGSRSNPTIDIDKPATGCPANAPLEFVSHNRASNSNTLTFTWTPPATDVGEVRIFVAGNAANGNGTNEGDRIYTANYTLRPQAAGPTLSSAKNAASFTPGIVSGSWIALEGDGLAGTTRIWDAATEIVGGRLPTSLDGVSVNINGKAATVYFISPKQLNVQAPTDAAVGPVQVEVLRNGQRVATTTANIERFSPGFFMFDPDNRKYIAAVNADGVFLGRPNLFAGATTRPAAPGSVILLFGTGFGPTNPAVPAGEVFSGAARTTETVRVTIGGTQATVDFAGLSGAGLYQLNVVVPDLPNGDHAVVAEVGGVRSQENAFITVQR